LKTGNKVYCEYCGENLADVKQKDQY